MTKAKPLAQAKEESIAEAVAVEPDWNAVKELYSHDRIVEIKVTGHNRGGLLVENDGLSGFIPFSHLIDLAGKEPETDRDASLEKYVGKTLNVKVIECVPEDGRVVFSERAALAEPGEREELFHHLEAGSRIKGTVTNITDFGVFVDLGGVEGLIHISELSWGRVAHPNQIVKLGEQIDVQVFGPLSRTLSCCFELEAFELKSLGTCRNRIRSRHHSQGCGHQRDVLRSVRPY